MTDLLIPFKTWFDTLPHDIKDDIGSLAYTPIAALLGRNAEGLLSGDAQSDFLSWLDEPTGESIEAMGKILLIREQIRFWLMTPRATEENWQETTARFTHMLQRASEPSAPGGMAEKVQRMLDNVPVRKEQYFAAAAGWRALCDTHWSDAALHAWFDRTSITELRTD